MLDTLKCFISPPDVLSDDLFQGGSVSEQFDQSSVSARLWRNPKKDDSYQPRVTYWRPLGKRSRGEAELLSSIEPEAVPEAYAGRGVGLLALEFSIPHMAAVRYGEDVLLSNLCETQIEAALDDVDAFVRTHLLPLPSVREWRVQRVDYAWNFEVANLLPVYMGALARLQIGSMSRHPYDVAEGVVWKSGTRWVKFYNKRKQLGIEDTAQGVLRYEVSNYRTAVANMCKRWFDCERVTREVIREGRALYCLAFHWDKLGLVDGEYGGQEYTVMRLREVFGPRVAQAHYVLRMIHEYGSQVYRPPLELVSKDMYYRYRRELISNGFLAVVGQREGDDDEVKPVVARVEPLRLPVQEVVERELSKRDENLKDFLTGAGMFDKKFFWNRVQSVLGLSGAQESKYLMERLYAEDS